MHCPLSFSSYDRTSRNIFNNPIESVFLKLFSTVVFDKILPDDRH